MQMAIVRILDRWATRQPPERPTSPSHENGTIASSIGAGASLQGRMTKTRVRVGV